MASILRDDGILTILTDSDLIDEYKKCFEEDVEVKAEAVAAYKQILLVPIDALDALPKKFEKQDEGIVGRRAPYNPLASPKLGKYRFGRTKAPKVEDPALSMNPLRGKLLVTINTTFVLLFVLLQGLVLNYTTHGRFLSAKSVNPMYGPQGDILQNLGGLDSNLIRQGETVRIFFAMWMHAGLLHYGLNALGQLQFFYMIEPDWGFWRTLFLFIISGVSGNLMSANMDPCSVTVGSSGGLFGLMGAMVIYCIEFWHSIPRPLCIIIFTFVLVALSFVMGFTGHTDNWAHLGGLLGGLFFCMATVTTLSACQGCFKRNKKTATNKQINDSKAAIFITPDGKQKKKRLKRFSVGNFGKDIPRCKCGPAELFTRVVGFMSLFFFWFTCMWYLWRAYEYQPLGHITFHGRASCCCCYISSEPKVSNWHCGFCTQMAPDRAEREVGNTNGTFEDFCGTQIAKHSRRLAELKHNFGMLTTRNLEYKPDVVTMPRLSDPFKDTQSISVINANGEDRGIYGSVLRHLRSWKIDESSIPDTSTVNHMIGRLLSKWTSATSAPLSLGDVRNEDNDNGERATSTTSSYDSDERKRHQNLMNSPLQLEQSTVNRRREMS